MSNKLLALYAFDEQLTRTFKRSHTQEDSNQRAPTAEEALDAAGMLWPYVLKLLGDYSSQTTAETNQVRHRFLVCLADRLIYAVRLIPLKLQDQCIKSIMSEIAELEVNQERSLVAELDREKLKFFSTYTNTESELHRATDYWSIWEREVKLSLQTKITNTIHELKVKLNQARTELESKDSRQAAIRDHWSDVRARLMYSSQPWWGSLKPPHDSIDEIPEWLTGSGSLKLEDFKTFASAVHRMLLLDSVKSVDPHPIWEALKLSLTQLISLLQRFIEDFHTSEAQLTTSIETVMTPLVNIVDALLFLLFARASEETQTEAHRAKSQLLQAEREISDLSDKLKDPEHLLKEISLTDPVVMRFRADARTPLVEAALTHVLEMQKKRLADLLDVKRRFLLTKGDEIRNFDLSKTKNFLEPWSHIWSIWNQLVGSSPAMVGLEKLLDVSTNWAEIRTGLSMERSIVAPDALPVQQSAEFNDYL